MVTVFEHAKVQWAFLSQTAMPDSALRAFAGSGAYGATFAASRGATGDRTLMSVLLVLACAMAIAEWVIRR